MLLALISSTPLWLTQGDPEPLPKWSTCPWATAEEALANASAKSSVYDDIVGFRVTKCLDGIPSPQTGFPIPDDDLDGEPDTLPGAPDGATEIYGAVVQEITFICEFQDCETCEALNEYEMRFWELFVVTDQPTNDVFEVPITRTSTEKGFYEVRGLAVYVPLNSMDDFLELEEEFEDGEPVKGADGVTRYRVPRAFEEEDGSITPLEGQAMIDCLGNTRSSGRAKNSVTPPSGWPAFAQFGVTPPLFERVSRTEWNVCDQSGETE